MLQTDRSKTIVQVFEKTGHLEESSHSSSSTFVSVHPSHEASSLDVSSTSVVGDALETEEKKNQSVKSSQSTHSVLSTSMIEFK